jgi:hypothetical protein
MNPQKDVAEFSVATGGVGTPAVGHASGGLRPAISRRCASYLGGHDLAAMTLAALALPYMVGRLGERPSPHPQRQQRSKEHRKEM